MPNTISGKASAGALVTLSGTASAVTTANQAGVYSFSGLAAGPYTVTPSVQTLLFSPLLQNVTIVASDIAGVNFLATSANNAGSTYTLQRVVDKVKGFADIEPVFNVGGWSTELAVTIATDVMGAICAVPFPWKWNEIDLPQFYTFSWQQDYALVNPDSTSVYGVEWLERGMAIDINSTSMPKTTVRVECGRSLPQQTGTFFNSATMLNDPAFVVSSLPNENLYYGTWGQPNVGNATFGNNPVAGSVYTNPLGNISMPANPINQIQDANGNFLVLTTYGKEGSSAPVAPPRSLPGTIASGGGATTIWTVVDPLGLGIRILEVPSQTGVVWQFNLVGQMPPVAFTYLQQTLNPLPDKYEPVFRQGFVAQAYRYSPEAKIRMKFKDEWQLWLLSLNSLRERNDRELEEYSFEPERSIMGSGTARNRFIGAANPFNYPRF
jgi:hypothetical protein